MGCARWKILKLVRSTFVQGQLRKQQKEEQWRTTICADYNIGCETGLRKLQLSMARFWSVCAGVRRICQ